MDFNIDLNALRFFREALRYLNLIIHKRYAFITMYFQTLPRQFNKIAQHRWRIAIGFLCVLSFLTWFHYFTYPPPLTPEQTNKLINQSESLKRVDNLCENLPKPEDFHLVRKIISGNSRTVSISHYYQSNLGYEKIKTFYLDWFNKNGWESEYQGSLDFRKNNYIIYISKGYWAGANYSFHCAEEL